MSLWLESFKKRKLSIRVWKLPWLVREGRKKAAQNLGSLCLVQQLRLEKGCLLSLTPRWPWKQPAKGHRHVCHEESSSGIHHHWKRKRKIGPWPCSVTVSYRGAMLQESRGFPRLHGEAEPKLPRREAWGPCGANVELRHSTHPLTSSLEDSHSSAHLLRACSPQVLLLASSSSLGPAQMSHPQRSSPRDPHLNCLLCNFLS